MGTNNLTKQQKRDLARLIDEIEVAKIATRLPFPRPLPLNFPHDNVVRECWEVVAADKRNPVRQCWVRENIRYYTKPKTDAWNSGGSVIQEDDRFYENRGYVLQEYAYQICEEHARVLASVYRQLGVVLVSIPESLQDDGKKVLRDYA